MKYFLFSLLFIFSFGAQAKLSIMQGLTTATSTQLNFIGKKGETYKVTLRTPDGAILSPVDQKIITKNFSVKTVVKLKFDGLALGKSYELSINDSQGGNLDRRHLKTLDLKKEPVTLALTSCMDDFFKEEQGPMWRDLLSQNPDMLISFGDNVYADKRHGLPILIMSPRILWERYTETREILDLYKADNLIPMIVTWDDHDYGKNDGGTDFKYKKESRETFDAFFSQEPVKGVLESGPGVSSKFIAFGQVFYLMDDRSFRTSKTHWGEEQENWLISNLKSTIRPSWIINGDQYFGGYQKFESFEKASPENFKAVMARIKTTPSPVFFVSGDRHLTELMKIEKDILGYETYEFTTSAIHAKVYPSTWDKNPNPRQIAGAAGTFNYGIVKASSKEKWALNIQAYGPSKKLLYEKNLEIKKAPQK